jgi:predicted kinase
MMKGVYMRQVKLLVGLPGARKTSWARLYVASGNSGTMILTLDVIRSMLFGKYDYREDFEPLVYQIALDSLNRILTTGYDCIVDDSMLSLTKASRNYIITWIRAKEYRLGKINLEAVTFDYSPKCVEDRLSNPRGLDKSRWLQTINEMMLKFEPVSSGEGFDSIVHSTSFSFS